MNISLIVAMTPGNQVIGNDGKIPWRLPADLKRFRELTMGKPIIMGRKTHESIGRALPGRDNIVVTRQEEYQSPGCTVVNNMKTALHVASQSGMEIMVIGGAEIYEWGMLWANTIYATFVHGKYDGNVFFPVIPGHVWATEDVETHQADEKNEVPYSYVTFKRAI